MQGRVWLAVSVLLAQALAGCADHSAAIVAELREINLRLERIEADLAARKPAADKVVKKRSPSGKDSRRLNSAKLEEIEFPEPPTPEAVRNYVVEVISANVGQSYFTASDPQVDMLARVGEENIEILLEFARNKAAAASYHANLAVLRIATEKSRAVILEELTRNRKLAQVVIKNGWEAAARSILIEGLKDRRESLPFTWIEAVANLRDPSTYELLIDYFVEGNYRFQTYTRIKNLPGINLDEAILKAWGTAKYNDSYERRMMATLAVAYGKEDALRMLVDSLSIEQEDDRAEARRAIISHTDARGQDEDLRKWYQINKDKLYFDVGNKKFRVQP